MYFLLFRGSKSKEAGKRRYSWVWYSDYFYSTHTHMLILSISCVHLCPQVVGLSLSPMLVSSFYSLSSVLRVFSRWDMFIIIVITVQKLHNFPKPQYIYTQTHSHARMYAQSHTHTYSTKTQSEKNKVKKEHHLIWQDNTISHLLFSVHNTHTWNVTQSFPAKLKVPVEICIRNFVLKAAGNTTQLRVFLMLMTLNMRHK